MVLVIHKANACIINIVFLFGLRKFVQVLEHVKYLYYIAWNTRVLHVFEN